MNARVIVLVTALIVVLLVPLFPVTVIPEWSCRLVYEDGAPAVDVRVDQTWKDYSLEFWRSMRHTDQGSSDVNGVVTFPLRSIRVSIVQVAATTIRDALASIDPHASYGPDAHILCRGSVNCDASYRRDEDIPKIIVVKK